jgi:hypothetical protein
MQTSVLRIETLTSPPITIQGAHVYVRSQLVQVSFPTVNGGLIWNRPLAIVVRGSNGQEKIVPIVDVTRTIMFTLAGLCFTGLLVRMFLRRKTSES